MFQVLVSRKEPVGRRANNPSTTPSRKIKSVTKNTKTAEKWEACGPDEIPVKALKAYLRGSTNMFCDLFQDIWKAEAIPEE